MHRAVSRWTPAALLEESHAVEHSSMVWLCVFCVCWCHVGTKLERSLAVNLNVSQRWMIYWLYFYWLCIPKNTMYLDIIPWTWHVGGSEPCILVFKGSWGQMIKKNDYWKEQPFTVLASLCLSKIEIGVRFVYYKMNMLIIKFGGWREVGNRK